MPTDAHRVLSVAISMIRQKDEQFHTYRIFTRQLIEFFPALKSDKNAIARIDMATDALMGSYIKIKKKNGWLKRNLVHSCQFYKNDGHSYVDIRLDDEILPFLIGITGKFSSPKIENIRYFKKENHFKLYAFFYSYLYRGNTGEVPLSALRDLLSIKKSQYKLVGHLKSSLLEPSIKLINRVTDIKVSCSSYKHGRRIAGFIFDIKRSPIKNLAQTKKLPIVPDKPILSAGTK
ncbi:MAG: replication initiation protein [Gammaproteobacteria bacterium]|nr:replication initiation protein [Gammaproteobacteria bacterium]